MLWETNHPLPNGLMKKKRGNPMCDKKFIQGIYFSDLSFSQCIMPFRTTTKSPWGWVEVVRYKQMIRRQRGECASAVQESGPWPFYSSSLSFSGLDHYSCPATLPYFMSQLMITQPLETIVTMLHV